MNKYWKNIAEILSFIALVVITLLMLNTIRLYTSFKKDIGFLLFKQTVVNNTYWRLFFYIHIFSILACLLAGASQFSKTLLKEYQIFHRTVGKIYVYNILLINVPACFILGIFSNGGIIGQSGFIVQDILWGYFTIVAINAIREKNISKHQHYMIMSYAITTTAITFRIMKHLFYGNVNIPYELFYGVNVWLSLFINLFIGNQYGDYLKKQINV